jgi:ACT domain-containing protein
MIYLEVKLPDIPGSLIEMIKPISQNGGNIYGILHNHDNKVNNMIPVNVWFELKEEFIDISIKNIQKELIEKQIEITKISIGSKNKILTFILSGHVFDTDITETIDRLDSKNIKVVELQAKLSGLDKISDVKMKVEFPESMDESNIIGEIEKICKEKDIFLIKS